MINNKKVAIDARMIEMSGIGTYIQHLLNHGIYDVALGDEKVIRKYDKNVKVIPYNAKIYSPKEQICFPNKVLKNLHISLVHFPHYNVPVSYFGDYIVTVHDLTHLVLPELLGNKFKQIYSKQLLTHALKNAKHILTVSEYSRNDIIREFNIDPMKTTVTYNAIDDDFVVKRKEEVCYLLDKYSIPKNKKIILYVGNLKPHKNLKALLKAFSNSKSKEDSIIILVGKAFDSNNISDLEDALKIKDKVYCTGIVDKNELVDFYNLADLFAFPSLYEGFGIPPLESMACATPVISSNSSSLPEVVGDAAYLFDPYNIKSIAVAMDTVLSDKNIKEELITKGMEQVKKFDWDITVNKTKRVIATTLNNKNRL